MKTLRASAVLACMAPGLIDLQAVYADPGPVSTNGIMPREYVGNFVSQPDNNQVCFDMAALGYIGAVTEDMVGIKQDPPISFEDGLVQLTPNADGRFLSWTALQGARVLAIIVKGGNAYNLYDYTASNHAGDSQLHSPVFQRNGKWITPQISHYNLCYIDPPAPEEFQGCTPGYWRNHIDRWLGLSITADFDATFGVDLFSPDITVGSALKYPQTHGVFAFHSVAALLNSLGGIPNAPDTETYPGASVSYPLTPDQVRQRVQAAVETQDDPETYVDEQQVAIAALKDVFAGYNELGCPLEGTRVKQLP